MGSNLAAIEQGMGGADEAGLDLGINGSRSHKGCLILLPELRRCIWESSVLILAGIMVSFAGLICSGLVSEKACLWLSGRHGQPCINGLIETASNW